MKRAVSILLVFGLLSTGVMPASGDNSEPKDPRKERERVRREKAAAAAKLDALEADADQLETALEDLADNISYQEALLADARDAQAEANEHVEAARQEVALMEAHIAELQAAAKTAALRAYTSSGSSTDLVSTMVSGNPADALQQQVLYGLVADDLAGVLDELRAAHRDLEAAQRKADDAATRADERRVEVETNIAALEQSVTESQQLATKIDDRIDETLAEAAALETLDKELSAEIAAREAALAAKLEAQRAANRIPTAEVTEDGDIEVPIIPTATNGLVKVNGITVDASIGPAIAQLVEWAAEDGIILTGGGYRSAEGQIAIRRSNCGSSNYDIFVKPPSQCRPPAARPGKSMHEKGLAVDFACNGALISRYDSDCYRWMAAHAPRVGLKNRRGEAWHWSTNGN